MNWGQLQEFTCGPLSPEPTCIGSAVSAQKPERPCHARLSKPLRLSLASWYMYNITTLYLYLYLYLITVYNPFSKTGGMSHSTSLIAEDQGLPEAAIAATEIVRLISTCVGNAE